MIVLQGGMIDEDFVSNSSDCNDDDGSIHPTTVWYADVDNDGYGDASVSETTCTPTLANATQDNTDCDDFNSEINPGKEDVLGNGIDDDCDGEVYNAEIGDEHAGGIVFYLAPTPTDLDGDGVLDTGLVCATADQSLGVQWYNGSSSTTGATASGVGSGATNTATIIAAQGAGTYASSVASSYAGGGFNDWFLPSKDELNLMYTNLKVHGLGSFSNYYYWSATENGYAWFQNFNNGTQDNGFKSNTDRVRAVRAF